MITQKWQNEIEAKIRAKIAAKVEAAAAQ